MSQARIKVKKRKEKNQPRSERGLRYWAAVGTLAAYSTFGAKGVLRAQAQQSPLPQPDTNVSSGQAQGLTVRRFDIAPGTLETVLARFAQTSTISVSVPTEAMKGIWSPGVAGLYTPENALRKLLTGTGIGYTLTNPTTAVLKVEGASTAVDVTATTLQD